MHCELSPLSRHASTYCVISFVLPRAANLAWPHVKLDAAVTGKRHQAFWQRNAEHPDLVLLIVIHTYWFLETKMKNRWGSWLVRDWMPWRQYVPYNNEDCADSSDNVPSHDHPQSVYCEDADWNQDGSAGRQGPSMLCCCNFDHVHVRCTSSHT